MSASATVHDISDKAKAAGTGALAALQKAAQSEAAQTFVQGAAIGAGVALGVAIVGTLFKAATN